MCYNCLLIYVFGVVFVLELVIFVNFIYVCLEVGCNLFCGWVNRKIKIFLDFWDLFLILEVLEFFWLKLICVNVGIML